MNPALGPLRRARLAAALLALLSTSARAQIVEVELRGTKSVRAQKKYVLELDGRPLLRGEPLRAVKVEHGRVAWEEAGFELYVLDPEEPEDLPYRWKDGRREARSDVRLASIGAADIVSIQMLAPELTLDNVASELRERRERAAQLERRKKGCESGSEAWLDAHLRLQDDQRRLQALLARCGFEPAARRLDDEVARAGKAAAAEERGARGRQARESIRESPVPSALVEAAQAISGGKDRFAVHQSRHLRIVHDERVSERRARQLLELGEDVIEGFLREFVDPYECASLIPDRPFSEFWFGPDEDEKYALYFEQYYRMSWGTEEERRHHLRWYGNYRVRSGAPEFLSYCRNPERDLAGIVVHRLGHELASLHFDACLRDGFNPGFAPDWLEESLGVYLSLEYLGASTTSCTARLESTVGKAAEVRAREYNERPADYYRFLARSAARPLDQLVLKGTGELSGADIAKGWCVVRFLARDGERGQDVLHTVCRLSRNKPYFLETWRDELRFFYSVPEGQDPIAALERLAVPPVEEEK